MAVVTKRARPKPKPKPTYGGFGGLGSIGAVPREIAPKPVVAPKPATTAAAPAAPVKAAPVYGAAPVTGQGQALRSDADKAMQGATTDWRDSVYRSVMGLGDPLQVEKFKNDPRFAGMNFSVDPTSTWSQIGRNEKQGLEDVDKGSLAGNTFFSGIRLNHRDDVSQAATYDRAGAAKTFESALADYARALAAAEAARNSAYSQASGVDYEAALAAEPEPADDSIPVPDFTGPAVINGIPVKGDQSQATASGGKDHTRAQTQSFAKKLAKKKK